MKRKTIGLLLGLVLSLGLMACGSENNVPNTGREESSETQQVSTEESTQESVTTEESSPEETEEVLSEEQKYWLALAKEFEGKKYDLTEILTEDSLKDLCSAYFTLGVGINGSTLENQTLNSGEYMTVVRKHFNSCTMTNLMKSCYILDQKGSQANLAAGDKKPALSFATIDPTLKWCQENGVSMRGHTLVWHAQAPDWFFRVDYQDNGEYVDRDTMLYRMESYIEQLLTHVQEEYPGVIYCWDVVNEAVDPDKGDKDSGFMCRMENDGVENPWYCTIGPDYVEMAFTYARKYAAEGVKLFYNDFNTFQIAKRKNIYALCESLKEKNLIDGIGMQGYWGISYPSVTDLDTTIREYAKLGLEIHITELSVDVPEETDEQFEKQAKKYKSIMVMLHNADLEGGGPANITNVTFFGLIDHYRDGDTTNTRLLDKDYQLKPAYTMVRDVFKACYGKKAE